MAWFNTEPCRLFKFKKNKKYKKPIDIFTVLIDNKYIKNKGLVKNKRRNIFLCIYLIELQLTHNYQKELTN